MTNFINSMNRLRPFAPLIIRVIVGGLFLLHGIDKFSTGISNVGDRFGSLGVPLSGTSALVVAAVEVVAGIALIAGLGTRLAALALAIVMVGALIFVKSDMGILSSGGPMPGAELDLSLLAGLLAVMIIGPGPMSADAAMGLDGGSTEAQASMSKAGATA